MLFSRNILFVYQNLEKKIVEFEIPLYKQRFMSSEEIFYQELREISFKLLKVLET